MSNQNSYHRLVNRGRKAGLNSQELSEILSTSPASNDEPTPGPMDGSGYASDVDSCGYRLCRQSDAFQN